jgi:hypothetical protein
LKSVKSGDIKNSRWTDKEWQTVRRIATGQAGGPNSNIDFNDIPRLTDEQLASMVRLRDVRR